MCGPFESQPMTGPFSPLPGPWPQLYLFRICHALSDAEIRRPCPALLGLTVGLGKWDLFHEELITGPKPEPRERDSLEASVQGKGGAGDI